MKWNQNIYKAALAAWKAGIEIMTVYQTDFEVLYKEDTSPVTQADQKADKVIREILEQSGTPIISEETKQVTYKNRKDWKVFWMVDPLDGTKEFISKNGEFTVNIAYIKEGKPIYGVLYVPESAEMYIADGIQKKIYRFLVTKTTTEKDFEELENLAKELPKPDSSKFDFIAISRSHLDSKTLTIVEHLIQHKEVKLIQIGSALKYAKLITGDIQLYFRFSPTMEWDNAAGHALCLAAGLEMHQLPDKKDLEYNTESLVSPYFLAGTKKAVTTLLKKM